MTGICRICGKPSEQPHTAETRRAHLETFTRLGYSLMCPSPAHVEEQPRD